MTVDDSHLAKIRAAYARDVVHRLGGGDPAVEAAFARVSREAFLGPPPWLAGTGGFGAWTRTSDPRDVYLDRLFALDPARGINNGQPSLHAVCIAALRLTKQDDVLHVGAGTGYYTAIIAELARSVLAYEIEPALAARATACLRPWPNVTVRAESAAGRPLPDADAIYVSAGATHPDPFWLDALRDGGRLLFPLTAGDQGGFMLLVQRERGQFGARFISTCGFINCEGARDPATAKHLASTFSGGGEDQVRSLTREPPPAMSTWFAGDGWYLSTEAPA